MKTLIVFFMLFVGTDLSAQTNVISLKSHSGDLAEITQETDNFGEPPWKMNVDTVIFIAEGTIIECGYFRRDTIFSETFNGYLSDAFKENYSPRCVFVGFNDWENMPIDVRKESKQNGISWIIVIVALLIAWNLKKLRSENYTLIICFLVSVVTSLSTSLNAQTNIISLKSHSGDLTQLHKETDNFGELYIPPMEIDTVKFIRNGMLVECRPNSFAMEIRDLEGNIIPNREYDTIRDASITKTLSPSIKNNYPKQTIFVGFDKEPTPNPHFNGMKKNGISWLFGIALVLLLLNFKNFGNKIKTNATLIFLLTIGSISSSTLFAQTNIISLKSHAGESKDLLLEEDNFGIHPDEQRLRANYKFSNHNHIDTVEFYRNGKIIQHYQNELGIRISDTLVDKNYTKELTPYLQNQYPQKTVFVGFKKQKLEAAKPFFEGMKRSGFSIWIIVFIGIVSITQLHRKKIVSCAKPSN